MASTERDSSYRRSWRGWAGSLRVRLVALFVLLALAMSLVFLGGMQKLMSIGWSDVARPLLTDYVDRMADDLGSPPSLERAQALVKRLPVTVDIQGPMVNWQSHPDRRSMGEMRGRWGRHGSADSEWQMMGSGPALLQRRTADGHEIEFGLNLLAWHRQPRSIGWVTLAVLLLLTALAYAYVRRLLRPLDDIRAGAGRFGQGRFEQVIPVRSGGELGDLATDINRMGQDIHRMLEAKRALLLAISHELRSPLTRARLNTELLPDQPELAATREALLRDLALMRDLVTDLLESERLSSRHAGLHLEEVDLGALLREVVAGLVQPHVPQELQAVEAVGQGDGRTAPPTAATIRVTVAEDLPSLRLDAGRMRLLLRNLLDNALRHSSGAGQAPRVDVGLDREQARWGDREHDRGQAPRIDGDLDRARVGATCISITVRDFGPGVAEDSLAHLTEPFYRSDSARQRSTGGVGLGLYLCRLVAQAHGGSISLRNAEPGLEVQVRLPLKR